MQTVRIFLRRIIIMLFCLSSNCLLKPRDLLMKRVFVTHHICSKRHTRFFIKIVLDSLGYGQATPEK